ncbi:hypothetical protein STW0522CIT27_30500 [Citrobacter portucalensis]|nr:hypothetical protein STW0522CIT27_30500 [Citrobacter portucalensis]
MNIKEVWKAANPKGHLLTAISFLIPIVCGAGFIIAIGMGLGGTVQDLSLDQILIPCAIRSLAARKPSSLLCRASQPSQRAPQLAIPVRLLSIKPPSLAIAM